MNTNHSRAGAVLVTMIAAMSIAAAQTTHSKLAGTSWQLVRIQSMDGKVATPKDRSKYTMEFGVDGNLSMQIDCNRGRATWKATEPNQLEIGTLAATRAMCPPGSLHDRVVKDIEYVRSYVMKDGHLFLSLMADGGIYEFEPMKKEVGSGR